MLKLLMTNLNKEKESWKRNKGDSNQFTCRVEKDLVWWYTALLLSYELIRKNSKWKPGNTLLCYTSNLWVTINSQLSQVSQASDALRTLKFSHGNYLYLWSPETGGNDQKSDFSLCLDTMWYQHLLTRSEIAGL